MWMPKRDGLCWNIPESDGVSLNNIFSIIAALLILCVFVFVHELGHFLMGRVLGFRILEFAIGMGPVVLKKERKGIQYSLRAFPIGGMCRFYGEDETPEDGLSFNAQKPWKRLLVLVAGPFMNVLFAVVFAAVTLMAYGDYMPRIASFTAENTLAESVGLEPGDILRSVDGKKIINFNDSTTKIAAGDREHAVITVERNGVIVDIPVNGMYNEEMGRNYLGINIEAVRERFGFFESIGGSVTYVGSMIKEMLSFIVSIFTSGVQQGDVVGPVGTIAYIGQAVRLGFETVLRIAVLISVNLGIMNLLPLPALDGGRIVFVLIEWIRGKPIKPEREGTVHLIGIVLLFALMIYLVFSDVLLLFGG